jgi:acyl-CoA dehydrogenase
MALAVNLWITVAKLVAAEMYRWARAARIYDGPDEVLRISVARAILKRYKPVAIPTEHVPTRQEAARRRFAGFLDEMTANL